MEQSTETMQCVNCGVLIVSTVTGYTHIPRFGDAIIDCTNPMGAFPEIDPERLNVVMGAFNIAFHGVPQDVDLVNRTRMALDACPEEVVREFGVAVGALAALIRERLG